MKIIIDIPEQDYKQGTLCNVFKCYSRELNDIIYNGTILSKGHGRLIDADALKISEFEIIVDRQYINEFCPDEPVYNYIPYYKYDTIKNAPTIIEEDK